MVNHFPVSDYIYFLHLKNEEQHLFNSAYPYEFPAYHLDANNDNGFGAVSIVYSKEYLIKMPRSDTCKDQSMETFVKCIKETTLNGK